MRFPVTEVGRLKAEIRQLDADLGDLEAERLLALAREDLADIRAGNSSSALRVSATELRQRKETLLDRLAERRGVATRSGSGSVPLSGGSRGSMHQYGCRTFGIPSGRSQPHWS